MRVFYTSTAKKDLAHLSREVRERVQDKIDQYAQTHNPLAFAKRLHDDPEATYRFGVAGDTHLPRNRMSFRDFRCPHPH